MTRSAPMIPPLTTRMAGVMKLFSKAYFTKKTTPRNKARPPIQAKSFTPRIEKFPRHVEAIRQVRRQRLHAKCFGSVMAAEEKVDSEIARRHRRPMGRFARDKSIDPLSRHHIDFRTGATGYETDGLRLLRP